MAGSEGTLTGSLVGPYRVGKLIGAGQLAEVYQAQHPGLPQPVALKVFAPIVAANATYMETTRDIAVRVQQLKAGHILPVQDFGRDGDVLYLSMPLMYESLRSVFQRTGCLPLHRAALLLQQIANGLAAAHSAGIIHRDLKPENVLLDARGQAFISDFGVGQDLSADSVERRLPSTLSSLIGTPAYMAPEQLRGQPTDQRTDVYALGVIFYEMLSGTPPYSGATIYDVAAKALTKSIPSLAQRVPGITPLLERAVLRALARDPSGRWPTVQRFVVGLNTALPARREEPDELPGSEATPGSLGHAFATVPLMPDAPADHTTARQDISPPASADADIPAENTGSISSVAIKTPDLRLFRVDPLPPTTSHKRPSGLVLAGAALLMLVVLGVGGALLAHAAQPSQPNRISPTNPPATIAPTNFIVGPQLTPHPTTQPTFPPAPQPTATQAPTATATSAAPAPTATPVTP